MGIVKQFLPILFLIAVVQESMGQELGWIQAQAIRDNLVSIRSEYGTGFGFIVGERDETLYIVTANHVVRGPDDGGPHDKANIDIKFFTEQGSTYSAVLEETWLSSQKEDLAVATITRPPRFKWRHEGFAPRRDQIEGALVWFVGRDGEWQVSDEAGQIISKSTDGMLTVQGFEALTVGGMSGGVIVSKLGVEGIIQSASEAGALRAMSLQTIKNFMAAWGHPWGIAGTSKKFTAHEKKLAFGKEFVVRDNDTVVIDRRYAELIVEAFSMGKNATIRFNRDVREWSITAITASFARGAKIAGGGINGRRGKQGEYGWPGSDCHDGSDGRDGRDGEEGTDGVNVTLKIGIKRIDGLVIDLSGGSGGTGGDGGSAGSGGSNMTADCTTGDGGDGGHAGDGGRGGNGGALVLDYFFLNNPDETLNNKHLRFFSMPGSGGKLGVGGHGGSNGSSHREYDKVGEDGSSGDNGRPGEDGRRGELVIRNM